MSRTGRLSDVHGLPFPSADLVTCIIFCFRTIFPPIWQLQNAVERECRGSAEGVEGRGGSGERDDAL